MTIESDFALIWPWDSRKQNVRIIGSQKQNEISRDGVLDTYAKTTGKFSRSTGDTHEAPRTAENDSQVTAAKTSLGFS